MKKMSVWRNAVIAVIVIGVLSLLLFAVMKMEPKTDDNEPVPSAAPVYTAYSVERGDVDAIDIYFGETHNTLKNKGDYWTLNKLAKDDTDSGKIDNLVTTCLKMVSNNEIEKNPSDLSVYGLDAPQITINVTLKSGEVNKLFIGDASPVTGEYFFIADGSDTVYSIYSYKIDTLRQEERYYRIFNRFNVDTSKITEIIMRRSNQPVIHLKLKDANSEGSAYNVWTMTEPYKGNPPAIDEYVDSKILLPISELELSVPAEKSGNYGLDKPSAEVVFVTAEYGDGGEIKSTSEQKLILGNTENNLTYVKLNNSDIVFEVAKEAVSFAYTDEFLVVSKLQGLADIAGVSGVEVTVDGKTTVIDIAHGDGNKFSFKVNGRDADEKKSKQVYQDIISVPAEGVYKNEALTSEAVRIKYTGYNGGDDTVIEYIPINELSCAVRRNGIVQFTVKRSSVDKMLLSLYEYEEKPN